MKAGMGKQGALDRKLSLYKGGEIDRGLLDFDPFLKEIFSQDSLPKKEAESFWRKLSHLLGLKWVTPTLK